MEKHAGWLVLLGTMVLALCGAIHGARAQTTAVPSFAPALDSLGPMTLNSKFAGLPVCSKAAGCTGYVELCNTTNTGQPDMTQCVKLNASASFRTAIALVIEQDTVTSVSKSSNPIFVGTVAVKPSAVDANVTP